MPIDARAVALDSIRQLIDCLQSGQGSAELTSLVEQCEQLMRAVDAFHMEAIRFCMYGLQRKLVTEGLDVPKDARRLIENAREALHAAGFQTR